MAQIVDLQIEFRGVTEELVFVRCGERDYSIPRAYLANMDTEANTPFQAVMFNILVFLKLSNVDLTDLSAIEAALTGKTFKGIAHE